jgi:anti-sigma regulatory factor (Ser/Thr protein kinase)
MKRSVSTKVVQILMPSRRSAVAPTVERVLTSVKPARLTREQLDNLAVAVAEALSNAAVHGNHLRPGLFVVVRIEAHPTGETVVEVRDSGRGFDVERIRDPTDPSHLLLPGGRGIFMMRKLVDEVKFKELGNVVSLKLLAKGRQTKSRLGHS